MPSVGIFHRILHRRSRIKTIFMWLAAAAGGVWAAFKWLDATPAVFALLGALSFLAGLIAYFSMRSTDPTWGSSDDTIVCRFCGWCWEPERPVPIPAVPRCPCCGYDSFNVALHTGAKTRGIPPLLTSENRFLVIEGVSLPEACRLVQCKPLLPRSFRHVSP